MTDTTENSSLPDNVAQNEEEEQNSLLQTTGEADASVDPIAEPVDLDEAEQRETEVASEEELAQEEGENSSSVDPTGEPENLDETVQRVTAVTYEEELSQKGGYEKEKIEGVKAANTAGVLLSSRSGKIGISIAAVAILLIILFATHIICFHEWADATCTQPRTCRICGKTQGEPLGHIWKEATCTELETCQRCGVKQGYYLDHDVEEWEVTKEATCTEEGTEKGVCTQCGKELTRQIAMVEHEYGEWETTKEATCTEEGKRQRSCKNCGDIQSETIEKVDHKPGEWQVIKDVTVTSSGDVVPGIRARTCTVCGTEIESEEYTIDLTLGQKNALKTASGYLSWGAFSYTGLIDQLEFEGFSTDDATFAADHCGADWFEQADKCAEGYMSWSSFSRSGLIDQLMFEGFTQEQAEHGAASVGY